MMCPTTISYLQALMSKGVTRARAHQIFREISSKTVVVPTLYLSPIKCVPTQYLLPSYGPFVRACYLANSPEC